MGGPKTITVDPNSELGALLREAAGGSPLLVDTGEATYSLTVAIAPRTDAPISAPSVDPLAGPTQEQVARSIEGIRKAAGSWRDVDADEFKAYIRQRRRTANRPSARW